MSVLDRFPHSTAELKRVKTVQFGVLSPDEIVSVFFLLFILFPPPRARFAKSRVCVCVCVACDRGRQNFSFFLSLFYLFSSRSSTRRSWKDAREREKEQTRRLVSLSSHRRREQSVRFFSLSLCIWIRLTLSLFFSNYWWLSPLFFW